MPVSPAMMDRILAYIGNGIAERKARGERYDPVHALIMELLTAAEDDRCAENLFAMAADWRARGDRSAFAEVTSGRVNIVELLSPEGSR